jgi:hypothetical protein
LNAGGFWEGYGALFGSRRRGSFRGLGDPAWFKERQGLGQSFHGGYDETVYDGIVEAAADGYSVQEKLEFLGE